MNALTQIFSLFLTLIISLNGSAQSNSNRALSDKKFNEICFLTSHNAYNSVEDNYLFPNQNIDLKNQLNLGVRAIMIDVYEVLGNLLVYHGFPFLGYKPASHSFDIIKTFLDENPKDVITIIFESYASESLIEQELKKSGLFQYIYFHNPENIWLKIDDMIEKNQRLVVFADKKSEKIENFWYLYMWDYAFETNFAVHNENEFNFKHLRGKPENEFFILNHFITQRKLGFGKPKAAKSVNSASFINHRLKDALMYYGRVPNFLVLDFVEIGNGIEVVEMMNQFNFWNHKIIPKTDSQSKQNFLDNRLFFKTKNILKFWAVLF